MDQERYEELEQIREEVKKRNVDTVARLLVDVQEHNHKVQAEMVDLRRMMSQSMQQVEQLRGELNAIKAMGYIRMGTGPTVKDD